MLFGRELSFEPGRVEVTAVLAEAGLTLVRGVSPRSIVLTCDASGRGPGDVPPVVLPHGLSPGQAAELSCALALAVAHYDIAVARSIANRIDAVLEAEVEGRRIPAGTGLGMGLVRGWFEAPSGRSGTTRRRRP